MSREQKVQKHVRRSIIYALEQDLRGDEEVMKETWEFCESDEEQSFAEKELARVIQVLKKLK